MECTFTPGAAPYASLLARRLLIRYLPGLLAVLCIPAIWAFFDSRMIYVCLITLFIIYPMIMSLAWLAAVAKPEVTLCSRPQRWTFEGDVITVDFLDSEGVATVKSVCFRRGDAEMTRSGRNCVFAFDNSPDGISALIIPADKVPVNLINNDG